MIHSKTCLNQLRETDKCICGSVKQKRENKMDTQIKPDYYVKNIDGSFTPIGMTDTDIDLINKTITVGNELEAKFVLASLRDEHAHALDVLTGKIEVLEAENEDLCTYSRHLNHDYHHITQRVKDLLAAVDKINPDVEGYFEQLGYERELKMTREEMRPFEFEALVCETNAIGAELQALVCETNAIGAELQGMKAVNEYRMQQGMTQAYSEDQFQLVANQYREMADKFRKLAE